MSIRRLALAVTGAVSVLSLAACSGGFSADNDTDGGTEKAPKAAAAEKVYRVAFNQTETHPEFVAITNLGKKMAEETDGKCSFEVFPNETLGNQKDSIELVQAGTVDFSVVAGPLLENFNPDFVVFDLPFTFDSPEHQWKVFSDEEITGPLFDSLQDQKIEVLGAFHAGVRNVYNSKKPIEKPEDLKGMKIRVIESDTNLEMMRLMGGNGAPMGQGEVYTAIQSGVIDGGENNESIYANLKHDEIAKYYSYTKHLMFPDYFITSPQVLEAMDADCRKVLDDEMTATREEVNELWAAEIKTSHEAAEAAGAEFNEADVPAFREAVQPLIQQKLNNDTVRGMYDKIRALGDK